MCVVVCLFSCNTVCVVCMWLCAIFFPIACVCHSVCAFVCFFFFKQEKWGRKPCCVTRRVPQLCVCVCVIDLSIFFVMSHAFLLFNCVLSTETARPVVWTDVVCYGCVCMCFSVLCDGQISIDLNQSINQVSDGLS